MNTEIINKLLGIKEGQTFECKRALKKPSDVLATICAFANTDGGIFVYGMADPEKAKEDKRLVGILEGGDNSDELLKMISNNLVPPLPKIEVGYKDITNIAGQHDRILVIIVEPSGNVHSLMSGQTYVRRGRQNNQITHQQAMQLQYEKGALSFEAELVPNATIDDLEHDLLEEFMSFNKSDEKDKFQFLKNLGLAEKKNDKICLNNAAILLFGKIPFAILKRKCGIMISH